MEYFNQQGHLTTHAFDLIESADPPELARLEISEHLSFCDECLDEYLKHMQDKTLLTPLRPVKNGVLMELRIKLFNLVFSRCASVILAASIAIILTLTGVLYRTDILRDYDRFDRVKQQDQEQQKPTEQITDSLSRVISDILNNLERNYEDEKK